MIILAKNAGFCYGVKKAVETVEALLEKEKNGRIYTIGKLIHNPTIIADLCARGVKILPEDGEELFAAAEKVGAECGAESPAFVVIRAHGIPPQTKAGLLEIQSRYPFFHCVDCTCPRVMKVQNIVTENTKNGEIAIIIGDKNHPEVRGIAGCAGGRYEIYGDEESLREGIKRNIAEGREENSYIVVSQTTFNIFEYKNLQKIIKMSYKKTKIFDTICNITENRQNEVRELSKNVDLMVIVGGRESSNTNKLRAIAEETMRERRDKRVLGAFLVEDASCLGNIPLTEGQVIGLTAGASTPGSIIQEVLRTMSDIEKNVENSGEEFAQLLEQSFKPLSTGETVKGIITNITPTELHIDLGAKVTGVLAATEISGAADGLDKLYKKGDEIEAVIVKISDVDGIATLSRRRIESSLAWNKIVAAAENGEILEGKYVKVVKGGLIMVVDGQQVFVPGGHTGLSKEDNLETLVGTTAKVKIIEVNNDRRRALASPRAILRDERRAKENEFWDAMADGKEFDGVVKSLTNYGAFVDLGGVDGLVHLSELSWKRIHHPSDVVAIGDKLHVFVKSFDREARKISLGCKTEANNPWNIFTSNYSVGEVVSVKIVSIMEYGAFAEIVDGVDGLIHISQLADHKVASVKEVVKTGDVVDAKITDIDFENHKVSLSIRALIEPANEEVAEEPAAETDAE